MLLAGAATKHGVVANNLLVGAVHAPPLAVALLHGVLAVAVLVQLRAAAQRRGVVDGRAQINRQTIMSLVGMCNNNPLCCIMCMI